MSPQSGMTGVWARNWLDELLKWTLKEKGEACTHVNTSTKEKKRETRNFLKNSKKNIKEKSNDKKERKGKMRTESRKGKFSECGPTCIRTNIIQVQVLWDKQSKIPRKEWDQHNEETLYWLNNMPRKIVKEEGRDARVFQITKKWKIFAYT